MVKGVSLGMTVKKLYYQPDKPNGTCRICRSEFILLLGYDHVVVKGIVTQPFFLNEYFPFFKKTCFFEPRTLRGKLALRLRIMAYWPCF